MDREVTTASPIAVDYSPTPLGRTLQALFGWAADHRTELLAAQRRVDARER